MAVDVEQCVRDRIVRAGGDVSFATYMGWCLYDEEWGYYSSNRPKVGKKGDFYTCTQVGDVLGYALVRAIDRQWRQEVAVTDSLLLVEWGAGEGQLAEAVLHACATSSFPWAKHMQYIAVERSALHRRRMQERLRSFAHVTMTDDAEVALARFPHAYTVVLANEWLDALPVHRVTWDGAMWQEHRVASDGHSLMTRYVPVDATSVLSQWLQAQSIDVCVGQTLEIPLEALDWIRRFGKTIVRGGCFLIDYGADMMTLTERGRLHGTLRCFQNHQVRLDPLVAIGKQDMTAHVNTTWCEQVAKMHGFTTVRTVYQSAFLVEHGALERLQEDATGDPFGEIARRNRAIRQLVLPVEDPFWVMTLWK